MHKKYIMLPMPEFTRPQETLPGLDLLALTVDGVARRAQAQDAQRIERSLKIKRLRELQDRAWTEHCEAVVARRQESWESVALHLRATPPTARDAYNKSALWRFTAQQQASDGSMVEICTSITMSRIFLDGHDARQYLDQPVVGKTCPDELLGVAAEGKRGKRHIPLEPLQRAHDLLLIDHADELKAKTTAVVLGSSQKPETLYEADLFTDYHNPNKRQFEFYMDPKNTHYLLEWKDLETEEAIVAHLHQETARPIVEAQYEQLACIGEVLLQSSPA